MGEGEELDESSDPFAGVGILNCPRDLVPLNVAGTDDAPYYVCPVCGLVRMTG